MKSRYPCVYRRGAGLAPRHASSLPRAHVHAATPSELDISTDDRLVDLQTTQVTPGPDAPGVRGVTHPCLTALFTPASPLPPAPASALHEAGQRERRGPDTPVTAAATHTPCMHAMQKSLKNSQFLKIFRPLRGHWRSAHAKHAALAYGARHRGMLEA